MNRSTQTEEPKPWDLPTAEIYLKKLLADSSISQREIASEVKVSAATINLACSKRYLPKRDPGFKGRVEAFVAANPEAMRILAAEGKSVSAIWDPVSESLHGLRPVDMNQRTQKRAVKPGEPLKLTSKEVGMLTDGARKQFKLFRHPFIDDILKDSDIFMSDEHRYIEAAMLDAARHGGFLAVIGEVGSGKSVMRRKVISQLRKDKDVLVIYPQTIDKRQLTSSALCDAIIMDISNETPRMKIESKARQVQRLLLERSQNGYRHVLIIEEAHDLTVHVLKYLKRFHELEDGYRKMLGIILVAQTELKQTFDESQSVDMREVIQRVQVAEIRGLNGALKDYLKVKFERIGCKVENIFAEDAYEILSRRLTKRDNQGKVVALAPPLRVNEYVIRAMNLAHELGEDQVTADVIEAL